MDFDHEPDTGRDRPVETPPRHDHQALLSARLVVGVVIVLIGVILLADNLGWFEARYVLRGLWPLALVTVGVTMVRSPDHRRSRSWGWVLITVGTWLFLDRIGWIHVSLWHLLVPGLLLFVGGTLVMGGIKLDLCDARMEGDSATVEVFAFWGGIEIYVPPDWTVTSKVTTLLGGFVDKRRPTSVVPTKTLVVRGMVVMGGIEVKN
jgi:hypothetical protein